MATEATQRLWRKRVAAWQRSGLTCNAFAETQGINPSTLTWWKWRLGSDHDPARDPQPPLALHFVELAPEPAARPAAAPKTPQRIEIVLDEGLCVRLPDDFDADALRRLLELLEARR